MVGFATDWEHTIWVFRILKGRWLPLVLTVAWGVLRGRFLGGEWLLPICGLSVFALLALQSEGTMEGRFRKPLEPIFLAAAIVMLYRSRHPEQALYYSP